MINKLLQPQDVVVIKQKMGKNQAKKHGFCPDF